MTEAGDVPRIRQKQSDTSIVRRRFWELILMWSSRTGRVRRQTLNAS